MAPLDAPPILLATANPHKVVELRAIFAKYNLRTPLLSLSDLPNHASLREPKELGLGASFEDNASIKARSYAEQTGYNCLADDSGLEVDALSTFGNDGKTRVARPGVISSHYCTDGQETNPPMTRQDRDARNNERVLRELAGVPAERRTARFVCVMAFARPPAPQPSSEGSPQPSPLLLARGTFEGRIGIPPRVPSGKYGFGYDPIFLVAPISTYSPNPYGQTAAELDEEAKNRQSHRGRAVNIMLDQLIREGLVVQASS